MSSDPWQLVQAAEVWANTWLGHGGAMVGPGGTFTSSPWWQEESPRSRPRGCNRQTSAPSPLVGARGGYAAEGTRALSSSSLASDTHSAATEATAATACSLAGGSTASTALSRTVSQTMERGGALRVLHEQLLAADASCSGTGGGGSSRDTSPEDSVVAGLAAGHKDMPRGDPLTTRRRRHWMVSDPPPRPVLGSNVHRTKWIVALAPGEEAAPTALSASPASPAEESPRHG
eukprot:CAMPEP_0195132694 /NCGR_PEP_ID=MMETSP0448-20130528/147361_1 /TAXON_ID=66468 /ORGANISM="Heterocapsa triquestra, Strain CCMP 448" /LENGTH=231 /DNA_ID=CAMNT_0040170721 /DNA_START=16 /DNA_END=707 /DNA_ORIENTATION=+